jgi:hypothetical protein
MPDATDDTLQRNAASLDAACRREMWAAARRDVPLGNGVRVRRRLTVTVDVAAGPEEGDLCMERLIDARRAG